MAVPLRHAQGLAGTEEKSEPLRQGTTVSKQSPGLGVVVGFNCVCVSFLRVIRCDSAGKQKQPLKHGGAFSLQGHWGWGEKGALHRGSGEHFGRAPELPSEEISPARPAFAGCLARLVTHGGLRGPPAPPPPPAEQSLFMQPPSASGRKELVISVTTVSVIFLLFLLLLLQGPGYLFVEKLIKEETCRERRMSADEPPAS